MELCLESIFQALTELVWLVCPVHAQTAGLSQACWARNLSALCASSSSLAQPPGPCLPTVRVGVRVVFTVMVTVIVMVMVMVTVMVTGQGQGQGQGQG